MSSTPAPLWIARAQSFVERGLQWAKDHQERFWSIVGVSGLTLILAFFIISNRQQHTENAWMQLGQIQGEIFQSKNSEALAALKDWESKFQSTNAAAYAQFIKADLLYKTSDYVSASQIYANLARSARPEPLRPLAAAAQPSALEMAGKIPEAQAAAQAFLDQYPDHFLASVVMIAQARLAEEAKNPAAASAVYDRYVLLYPQSPWTDLAKSRIQALGGSPSQAIPSPK